MAFSLKHLLQEAGHLGGSAIDAIVPGDQSALHRPAQPQPVRPNQSPLSSGLSYPDGTPNLNDPDQNPTSVPRVWGALAAENVADQQGFTPSFRSIVLGAKPIVDPGTSGLTNKSAGGEYHPDTNQIHLRSDNIDPYTITHEGLHAAYQRKTPQAQASFMNGVAPTATPNQQHLIDLNLESPLYSSANNAAAGGNTFNRDTEVHSYLPMMGTQSPAQKKYYGNYFSNPNFFQEMNTKYKLRDLILPPHQPQFSDWQDN